MAVRSAVRRRFPARPQRRKLVWARARGEGVLTAVAPTNSINMLADFETILGSDLVGATIMRVRGQICVHPNVAFDQHINAVAGLQVIDGSAFVGAPQQLSPIVDDRYGEWFMYVPFVRAGSLVIGKSGDSFIERIIDVRAKRRIDELRQMLLMGISIDPALSQGVTYAYNLSILVALP